MESMSSVLSIEFNESTYSVSSRPVYQYDHGLSLCIHGVDNLVANQIHYAASDIGKALNILADKNPDGTITAGIPDVLLQQAHSITAYLYVEDEASGYTARTIYIPMIPRSKPESISMDSPSVGIVNEISAQLNSLIKVVDGLKKETIEATQAANTATSKANNAAGNAQDAADKLNTISFEVNPEDGCLYMFTL